MLDGIIGGRKIFLTYQNKGISNNVTVMVDEKITLREIQNHQYVKMIYWILKNGEIQFILGFLKII